MNSSRVSVLLLAAVLAFAVCCSSVSASVSLPSSTSGYVTGQFATTFNQIINQALAIKSNLTEGQNLTACWKGSKVRGVGVPISSCSLHPTHTVEDAGLCYVPCKTNENYYGVGPVCWQHCQEGWKDEGALCANPDGGKVIAADNSHCPWYDKCGLTLDKGCSICPSGYHNDGCTCRVPLDVVAKKSYGRGVGVPLGCAGSKPDYDAGLCYTKCGADLTGIGPVCWQETCPSGQPASYGALCCTSEHACSDKVQEMAKSVLTAVADAIEAGEDPSKVEDAIKAAIEAILEFVLPLCTPF